MAYLAIINSLIAIFAATRHHALLQRPVLAIPKIQEMTGLFATSCCASALSSMTNKENRKDGKCTYIR
ncbi:MAG: hypothetical protein A2W19_16590 [Spirochaetes bacterium RBG_16_49_21]|nr:MAG: hypothetical protein A2W19_16590 [Spirochaetes bacterium RBG_16_49_21]